MVYLDDGSVLSGCSVGTVYRDRPLIGSVFESFFLDCRMPKTVISDPLEENDP